MARKFDATFCEVFAPNLAALGPKLAILVGTLK